MALNGFPIEFRPAAVRDLRDVAPHDLSELFDAISLLAFEARPAGSTRLKHRPGYRLQLEDYAVDYTVDVEANFVQIVTVRSYETEESIDPDLTEDDNAQKRTTPRTFFPDSKSS